MNQPLTRLKTLLQFRYRFIYIAFALSVFILTLNNFYYIIGMLLLSYYIHKNHREMIPIILIVVSLYTISYIVQFDKEIDLQESYDITIIEVTQKEPTKATGQINNTNVILYFSDIFDELTPGDKLIVQGDLNKLINNTIPGTFNYKDYLKSKKVYYQLYVNNIEDHTKRLSIYDLRYSINDYIEKNHTLSKRYIKTFILADKSDFEEDLLRDTTKLGISHLFAVSGLHVGLLIMAITYIYKKFSSDDGEYKIIIPILILYIITTSYSPSIVRAAFLYIGLFINKKLNIKLSTLDVLSIIYIFLLLFNPNYVYNPGFILSFLVTFSILLTQYMIYGKSKNHQIVIITIISFMTTIPVVLSLNYEINLYTLVINIIMILYMTVIILPLGYITFIIYPLDTLLHMVSIPFEYLIEVSGNINLFSIKWALNHPFQIMIYYGLLISVVSVSRYRRQLLSIFIIFIAVSYNINAFDPLKKVTMIDVYGDSILVQDSFNRCNILIDTGVNDKYDSVITYLKSKNIRRIDLLVISHNHSDHNGEMKDIIKEFEVTNVIQDDTKDYNCGSLFLDFHQVDKEYKDTNNMSSIFTLHIANKKYLFTGDIEYDKEEEFTTLYDIDVDYLKSPHHGSITSSTVVFLENIAAENVLVSCFRKNTHGHPHEEVIKRYKDYNMNIYRTDELGTIEFVYILGYEFKKSHPPN